MKKSIYSSSRSKLNDDQILFVLEKRYPLEKQAKTWAQISQCLHDVYDLKISQQALKVYFEKHGKKFLITRITKELKDKISTDFKKYYFAIKNQPDYKFNGKLIVEIKQNNETMQLYATDSNKLICLKTINNETKVTQVVTTDELRNFFGWTDQAKALYEKLYIEKYIEVT